MEPLVFAILAGLTPPHIETVLIDQRLEDIPYDEPTDLVAITVETYNARNAYQIAMKYRKLGVPVVMGGYHITFLPDEALEYCDAVVIGDAEGSWEQLLEDFKKGELKARYLQNDQISLADLKYDRSIFNNKKYTPVPPIQYGRGCKFACDFCSIRAFYGTNLRQRPVRDVVEEIESLEHKHLFIVDDNIFVDIKKARAFFEALIPLKIRWSCQISIDIARDPELMKLLEKSGCTTAVVGFESLDERNLKQMKKNWNIKWGTYQENIKKFQHHGIMIYGTFVVGYDYDTPDVFDGIVEFAIESKFYLANVNPLTPMPGAELYNRLAAEKRLIYDKWWLDPDYRYGMATFYPKLMTPEQLTTGCFEARKKFNTYSSITRRMFDPKTTLRSPYRMGVYLLSNWISRREILRKQGLPLGDEKMKLTPLKHQVWRTNESYAN